MNEEAREAKNARIAESIKATRAKRKQQTCKVFTLKLQANKMSKKQADKFFMVFVEAKWLRNHLLSQSIPDGLPPTKVTVLNKDRKPEERTLVTLSGHMRQAVLTELQQNRKSLASSKANGQAVGRLKYCSKVTSINLKEYGRTYKFNSEFTRVQIQKLGWVRVKGGSQLRGFEIANAKLLNKPDGYYLTVTCFEEKKPEVFQPGTVVGLDMGVKTHITLSDGSEVNVLVGETERLKRLQRKLSRQMKGSNRYRKTRELIQREYQKMDNKKDDTANKFVHQLLNHELVFMQDEQLSSWRKRNGVVRSGRKLQHSILGRVKAKLKSSERVVMLRKNAPTTQACVCGARNKHQLDQRIYFCSSCGYSAPRDVHAAQNMVRLGAAAAPVRSQALVEGASDWTTEVFQQLSVKREAFGSSART